MFLALFAYSVVCTGTPLRATDKLKEVILRSGMDRNFRCARTKTAAIIKVCLLKLAIENMRECLSAATSIAIHYDSTTLRNKKVLVIVAKCFIPKRGVVVKLIDVRNVLKETAPILVDHILKAIKSANIDSAKIHIICADNTNTNFGGFAQEGYNNVGKLLDKEFNRTLFRNGCLGHIANNAFEASLKEIEPYFNMAKVTSKTRNFFHQKVLLFNELHDVAKKKEVALMPMLPFGPTRWTSAHNTLKSLKHNYTVFQTFFREKAAPSDKLKDDEKGQQSDEKKKKDFPSKDVIQLDTFFTKKISFSWVELLEQFAGKFRVVGQSIQGPTATIMEGVSKMNDLFSYCQNSLQTKRDFLDSSSLDELSEADLSDLERGIDKLLSKGSEYLKLWLGAFEVFKKFNWASLNCRISKEFIKVSIDELKDRNIAIHEWTEDSEAALVREITKVNSSFDSFEQLEPNDFINKSPVDKWNMMFVHNGSLPILEKIVSLVLSMSPSNSVPEGIFSQLKHFWTDDKSNLDFLSVFAFLMIRFNLCTEFSIEEFKEQFLEHNDTFLKEIRSSKKYIDLKHFKESNRDEFSDLMEYFARDYSELIEEYPCVEDVDYFFPENLTQF